MAFLELKGVTKSYGEGSQKSARIHVVVWTGAPGSVDGFCG